MNTKIENFVTELDMIDPTKAQIVETIRAMYKRISADVEERFIYGGVGFFLHNELIGGVFAYKKHVSAEFSRGNELLDPGTTLEGKGKVRRHIKLFTADDVENKHVESFVKQIVDISR
jgi:hypothetical protein